MLISRTHHTKLDVDTVCVITILMCLIRDSSDSNTLTCLNMKVGLGVGGISNYDVSKDKEYKHKYT